MGMVQRNTKGRTTAFGTYTESPLGWGHLLRSVGMRYLSVFRPEHRAQQLAFLHYAHWIVLGRRKLKRLLAPRGCEPPGAYLFFLSQFSGGWADYLEAFSFELSNAVDAMWGGTRGWPGAKRVAAFLSYVECNELESQAFYLAYEDADANQVRGALHARSALERFAFETEGLAGDDAALVRAYDRMLMGLGPDLSS